MKTKIFIMGFVCLFLFSFSRAEEKFGFTGEFYQKTLIKFPISLAERFEVEDEFIKDGAVYVKALMVGIADWEPDNPEYETFDFWSYHWPEYSEWWIGFIVANYSNSSFSCTITMQLKGPGKSKITRKAVLQPNQATLFKAKVNLANQIGVYTAIGKISGIGGSGKVKTRFYIYEIW